MRLQRVYRSRMRRRWDRVEIWGHDDGAACSVSGGLSAKELAVSAGQSLVWKACEKQRNDRRTLRTERKGEVEKQKERGEESGKRGRR